MKKTFKFLLVSMLALALLVACGGTGNEDTGTEDAEFKAVVVLDSGGIDDKSFNESTWDGVQKFLKDNNLKSEAVTYLSSKTDGSDYVSNLESAAEQADIVIAVGFLFEESLKEVAPKYKDTPFLFIDGFIEGMDNVHNTTFADEEGSYYVGLIAGARAKADGSNKVGFIGGIAFDTITAFQAGFEQGVWEANPEAEIFVDYVGDFANTGVAGNIASKMYNNGINIIYHASGDAGNGIITEAKNYEDKYVIGVDKDQYEAGKDKDGRSVVLTSMLKGVDVAAYDFLTEYYKNKAIVTDVFVFNTANEGIRVELSEDRNLEAEEIATVKEYMEKVISGEIDVTRQHVIEPGKSATK